MANSKDPATYPALFWDLVNTMEKKGTFDPIHLPCPSHSNAQAKRSYFSGFRSALKHHAETSNSEEFYSKHRASKRIKLSITQAREGWTVVFSPKGEAPWLAGLSDQLCTSLDRPEPTTTQHDPSIPLPEDEARAWEASRAKDQRRALVSHWQTRLFMDPEWLDAKTEDEKLCVLIPKHQEKYGIDPEPLLNDHPLENLGI